MSKSFIKSVLNKNTEKKSDVSHLSIEEIVEEVTTISDEVDNVQAERARAIAIHDELNTQREIINQAEENDQPISEFGAALAESQRRIAAVGLVNDADADNVVNTPSVEALVDKNYKYSLEHLDNLNKQIRVGIESANNSVLGSISRLFTKIGLLFKKRSDQAVQLYKQLKQISNIEEIAPLVDIAKKHAKLGNMYYRESAQDNTALDFGRLLQQMRDIVTYWEQQSKITLVEAAKDRQESIFKDVGDVHVSIYSVEYLSGKPYYQFKDSVNYTQPVGIESSTFMNSFAQYAGSIGKELFLLTNKMSQRLAKDSEEMNKLQEQKQQAEPVTDDSGVTKEFEGISFEQMQNFATDHFNFCQMMSKCFEAVNNVFKSFNEIAVDIIEISKTHQSTSEQEVVTE